ncbi:MAG: RelA/SpoT family protein [Bacteroidia bacterium]|nr:RelA/SpoT family protein [Bacteroidia bacterium]
MDTTTEFLEKERKDILNAYRSLMRVCYPISNKSDRKEIRKAFEYSLEAHKGARRKSGEPYIFHPISVAKIVVREVGLDPTSVVCALLHDVVEDTFAELEDIRREFGREVEVIIDGLTKISGVFDHKSSAQAENFRKMLLTLSDDIRVILIKLADRLHNMRTLQHMKKESQLKIASETLYLYAPLANRLGLHEIKIELEDLSLKYTEPSIYMALNSKLKKNKRESRYYIQSFIRTIREKLNATGLDFKIKDRFKTVYSIYAKMQRQNIPFEEVYDLFAIRIILNSSTPTEKADCWRVYSLLTELYTPNPERLRDWITIPKSNGYESLHVTVMGPRGRWIEVQIRSERMDFVAEKGLAAHWRYKENDSTFDNTFNKWLGHVRELLENPNMNAVDVVREFKTNLVTEEVFVFTPKGDLIKLPADSTVIDFAYEIHSRIGDTCIGAKVNNSVVPLSYTLHNGDQVEIISSKKQIPKEDWLNYAKTSKAKHKIKDGVKREKRIIADKGREIFQRKARKFNVDEHSEEMKELLAYFKIPSEGEFFYLIGARRLDMEKLQAFIDLKKEGKRIPLEAEETGRKRLETKADFEELLRTKTGKDSDMLMIGQDMDFSDYRFGHCCQPIPGDDILAFFDPDQGVVIHRTNCAQAIQAMSNFGSNIIKSKWTEMHDISFLAGIRIIGEDRQGMMNSLIKIISISMKLNIRSITIDSQDGMFEGTFKVFIRDTSQLDKLLELLGKVSGVFSASRVEVGSG